MSGVTCRGRWAKTRHSPHAFLDTLSRPYTQYHGCASPCLITLVTRTAVHPISCPYIDRHQGQLATSLPLTRALPRLTYYFFLAHLLPVTLFLPFFNPHSLLRILVALVSAYLTRKSPLSPLSPIIKPYGVSILGQPLQPSDSQPYKYKSTYSSQTLPDLSSSSSSSSSKSNFPPLAKMKTFTVATLASGALLSLASAQEQYQITPDSVSQSSRDYWCQQQITQCPVSPPKTTLIQNPT